MKNLLFLTLTAILYVFNTISATAITLKEAMLLAYKNSEQVFIKKNEKDLSTINFHSAIAKLFPQFSVENMFIWSKMDYPGVLPGNTVMGRQLSINAATTLSFYKSIPNVIAEKKNVISARYAYNEFLESFGLLFISTYMDILYYTDAIDVYLQMGDMLEKKRRKVAILNKYGTGKRDKVVLADAQFYENKANEINMRSLLDKSKNDYKILTGIAPEDLQIPSLKNIVLPFKKREDYVSFVLQKNSKLLKKKEQLLSQKIAMTRRNLDLLPDIFAKYSYVKMSNGAFRGYNYIGLGLSLEINGANDRLGIARKGYKDYRMACLSTTLTEKEVEQEAIYSWDQYWAMLELVKATEKALKASRDSLKEVKVSASSGMATFIDQMDIENRYLNANLKYLEAKKSLILAYYKLISLTGVGYIPIV